MRIVFAVSALLLVAVMFGARVWDGGSAARDVAEIPDDPGPTDDGDEKDAFVLPELPRVVGVELPRRHCNDRVGESPRGRPFVSEIFRPPILSRA